MLEWRWEIFALPQSSSRVNVQITEINPTFRQHKHHLCPWLSLHVKCLVEIALEEKTGEVQSSI